MIKKLKSPLAVVIALFVVIGSFNISSASTTRTGKFDYKTAAAGTSNNVIQSTFGRRSKSTSHVADEVLVKYKNNKIDLSSDSGISQASNFSRSRSLERRDDIRKSNISVLKIKDNKTVEQKIAELREDPNVEYAQPNFQYQLANINTDDAERGLLWALDNVDDADIDAPEAWAINEGTNSDVIVAVIDTGVAYNHPDLASNMWDGTACEDDLGVIIPGGCNHGYDYEDGDNTPLPTSINPLVPFSHGSHVAGTIAAVKGNTKGIIGVAPKAKIMALKPAFNTASIIRSINFAKENGAKIINASWGSGIFDPLMKEAIEAFPGLFIAAAGNNASDNDTTHFYPSDYNLDNIISVAATNQSDSLAHFSSYGATSVDVGAPGTNIRSTVADSTMLEDFYALTAPAIPLGWATSTGSNWGTIEISGNKALYGDLNIPYADNTDTTVTSGAYDLGSGTSLAYFNFLAQCDTEYIDDAWADYMQLEYSADGINFSTTTDPAFLGDSRWDEYNLDYLVGNRDTPSGAASFYFANIPIPAQYLTSNFHFRFRWVTNDVDNDHRGCSVDDIRMIKFSDGSDEKYGYSDGTSMAAPHVAGLAALILGTKPSLTNDQVKSVILNTGDTLPSLDGKTVTGKRINAFNALSSITPLSITDVQATSTTQTSTRITWSTNSFATSSVKYSTTSLDYSNTVYSGTSTKNHDIELTGLTASTTYYFYAESADLYGNIATSTEKTFTTLAVVPDTTSPIITLIGSSTINIFVGDIYVDAGATSTDNIDGDITNMIIASSTVNTALPGTYMVTYNVSDSAGNPATPVVRTVIVSAVPVTLSSIAITTPANKLTYNIGEALDITGLVVTGTYSDLSTKTESITLANVTGFNSAVSTSSQVLTINFGGKTATYTIAIVNPPEPQAPAAPSGGGATSSPGGGGGLSGIAPIVTGPAATTTQALATTTQTIALQTDPGCVAGSGHLFSVFTGRPCPTTSTRNATTTGRVLGASTFKFTVPLRKGMTHDSVIELQNRLRSGGFLKLATSTKFFGPATFNAVKAYQKARKLPTTGFVGPMTIAELNK